MKLEQVEIRSGAGTVRLVGHVTWRGRTDELYFEYPEHQAAFVSARADGFAAVLLPAAMRAGEDLEIVPPVSPSLAFSLPRIRDAFHCWHPDELARIALDLTSRPKETPPDPRRAATFFSGGVDSFYTLLKYLRSEPLPVPLGHLIFMRGMAFPLESGAQVEAGVRSVSEVAARLGLEAVVGTTNLRSVFPEPFLMWERHFFGSALAGTALTLGGGFDYVCIPSSFTYRHLVPHGSHPLLDEWYSTEAVRLVHDGCEVSRATKVAKIVEWDRGLVTEHLRVCFWNADGAHNCGKCRKCVRTAIALEIVGALRDTPSFVEKDPRIWAGRAKHDHLVLIEENLALARERKADPALVGMLRAAARQHVREERLMRAAKALRMDHAVSRAKHLYWSMHRPGA